MIEDILFPISVDKKIIYLDDVSELKELASLEIVTTNGCFDVFHYGHLYSLAQARSLGDYLVVGLNSDASVSRLKGPSRPVFPERKRARVLASLAFVDLVVIFDEDTPVKFLESVRPAVHCKGEDYRDRILEIPEFHVMRELGGRVELLSLEEAVSSTLLIKKIQEFG